MRNADLPKRADFLPQADTRDRVAATDPAGEPTGMFAGETDQELRNEDATRDVLEAVARHDPPESYVLALGCAGWGAGQLEDELRHNAWLVVDFHDAIVFDETHDDKWERAIKTLGFDPAQLMGDVGRA